MNIGIPGKGGIRIARVALDVKLIYFLIGNINLLEPQKRIDTLCEVNKSLYPYLSNFTLTLSIYTIQDLRPLIKPILKDQ